MSKTQISIGLSQGVGLVLKVFAQFLSLNEKKGKGWIFSVSFSLEQILLITQLKNQGDGLEIQPKQTPRSIPNLNWA